MLGGQFDWGGRLLKSNGGARRLAPPAEISVVRVMAQASLTARQTSRAGTKVGHSDLAVARGSAVT